MKSSKNIPHLTLLAAVAAGLMACGPSPTPSLDTKAIGVPSPTPGAPHARGAGFLFFGGAGRQAQPGAGAVPGAVAGGTGVSDGKSAAPSNAGTVRGGVGTSGAGRAVS